MAAAVAVAVAVAVGVWVRVTVVDLHLGMVGMVLLAMVVGNMHVPMCMCQLDTCVQLCRGGCLLRMCRRGGWGRSITGTRTPHARIQRWV